MKPAVNRTVIWTLVCCLLGSCGPSNKNTTVIPLKASLVRNQNQNLAPLPNASEAMIKPSQSLIDTLDGNHLVPLLIIAFSDPGNSDLNIIRQKIHQADALFAVDQDLQREREFIDYPYTVDSYLISVKSKEAYSSVLDCTYRFPKVKMLIIPFQTVKLKTFLEITYTKPLLKDPPTRMFWAGDSISINIPRNFSEINLEDATTYVSALAPCRELSLSCFNSLFDGGYFKDQSLLEGQIINPLEFLNSEISKTLALLSKGFTGDVGFSSVFNSTYDKSIIKNMTLRHEIWVTGTSQTIEPPNALLKVAGSDLRPIVSQTDNGYLYMLPILVTTTNIPLSTRSNSKDLGVYFSQLQKLIVKTSGLAGL